MMFWTPVSASKDEMEVTKIILMEYASAILGSIKITCWSQLGL